jgi:integrase
MLSLAPKYHKSRAKLGKAAWCVDTRRVLHRGTRTFYSTKADAQQFIEQLKREHTSEARSSTTWKWTFGELQKKYISQLEQEYKKGEKSQTCLIDRKRHTKLFVGLTVDGAKIKDMKVRDLTKGMVAFDVMDQLREGRTKKTVENILTSVGQMIMYSLIRGCRETNPLTGVERRGNEARAERDKAKRIAPAVIDSIMAQMTTEWRITMRFACTTGLRQGEQRALTWGCLDLDNSKVNVTRSVKHKTRKVGTTKTKSGQRTVPLTRDMVQALKELYIRRGRPNEEALVFCSNLGTLRMPFKYLKALHRACDAAGVERIRWHDLRHYYASKLLMAYGDDLYRVKSYMGHATIAITQDTYGHWLDQSGEDTEAVDKLSAVF